MNYIIIFIIINIFCSIFIVKNDFKERKILNSFLIKYSCFFCGFKAIDFYFYPLKYNYLLLNYYILALLIPFILYFLKIWGAGDSKLLTLYFIFLPNVIIEKFYCIYIIKYLNILFIISFITYFIFGFIKIIKERTLDINKTDIYKYLKFILFIILVLNFINNIFYLKIELEFYITLIFNIIIIFFIGKIYPIIINKKYSNFLLIILFLINIKLLNIDFIKKIIYALMIFFIKRIIEFSENRIVKIEELKIGDTLSKKTLQKFLNSKVRNLPKLKDGKTVYILNNMKELESIRRWKNSKYGEETVEVEKIIPFSIYICISYIYSIMIFFINNYL